MWWHDLLVHRAAVAYVLSTAEPGCQGLRFLAAVTAFAGLAPHICSTLPFVIADNMLVRAWLPQQDLLGHPAVKVYLTHGGIHSMYEALWHGKPMVLVPMTADQYDNSR